MTCVLFDYYGKSKDTEWEVIEHDFTSTTVVEGAALVAKLFTKRRVNLEAVARTLKGAWKTK